MRWGEKILDGEQVPLHARLIYGLGELLVYGPLKNRFGLSRIRVGYTAGEAIGPEIFRFYRALGINLKQLYGQTEASVYVTAQPDGEIDAETVGKASPDVEIKISETGEVLFRSPGVFVGYYRDPEKDGRGAHAGRLGAHRRRRLLRRQTGHLKIIDRAKDVGRLADGTLFAPKYIENKLKFYPNIREAVAVGDGRDFVCAMVNIDLTAVGSWAERNNVVLRLVSGARRPPSGLRHDRAARRRGEQIACRRKRSWPARRSAVSWCCRRSSMPTTAN